MVYWMMVSVCFSNSWLGDGMATGNQPFVCFLEVLKYGDSRIFLLKNVHTKDFSDYHR